MFQEGRLKFIVDYVTKNKKASTKELSELLSTSVVTIRADLKILQEKDLLVKTHGGVMINSYKINDVIPSNVKFAKCITAENLTAFTNDLQIAIELSKKRNIDLTVSGGTLIPDVYTLTSYEAVNFYKHLHVEKLFLSCDAIDAEFGISNRDKREVEIKKAMLKSANEVILMADHSKMNNSVLLQVADFEDIDKLIADDIPANLRAVIQSKGVEIITE